MADAPSFSKDAAAQAHRILDHQRKLRWLCIATQYNGSDERTMYYVNRDAAVEAGIGEDFDLVYGNAQADIHTEEYPDIELAAAHLAHLSANSVDGLAEQMQREQNGDSKGEIKWPKSRGGANKDIVAGFHPPADYTLLIRFW